MPFFRQTSLLQPFLFLFAAFGLVTIARGITRRPAARAPLVIALCVAAGVVQWGQAASVFQAHQALGQTLEWVYTHKGDHPVGWLPIGDSDGPTVLDTLDGTRRIESGTWLISYFPWQYASSRPALRPALEETLPLAAKASFFATEVLWAEARGFGHNDLRADPLLRDVRVLDAATLGAGLAGVPLAITAVVTDSEASPIFEGVNVFDRGQSPDGNTFWASDDTPAPHWLEMQFAEPVSVGALDIVLPMRRQSPEGSHLFGSRIGALSIEAADSSGAYRTVWRGADLDRYTTIRPVWNPLPVTRLRVVVQRQTFPDGETAQAAIEEIVFPGYDALAPKPRRPLPPLVLDQLRLDGRTVLASGMGLTRRTALVIDGERLVTRLLDNGQLAAEIPEHLRAPAGPRDAYLTDSIRDSNAVWWPPHPPVLRQLQPASLRARPPSGAGTTEAVSLTIAADNVTPTTIVLFDAVTLPTSYQDERTLVARVPLEFVTVPARHTITLRNAQGDSTPLEFVVTEDAAGPPVLKALDPPATRVNTPFNVQPDGRSALRVETEQATPRTVVLFGPVTLETRYESARALTALVPPEFLTQPVWQPITLRNSLGESNSLDFVVEPN
jgi:hypothetical protein